MLFSKPLVVAALLAQSAVAAVARAAPTYKNMAYYANWNTDYTPSQLNVPYLTHIIYAFADITPKAEVISSDPYNDYQKLFPGDTQQSGSNAYGNIKQLYLLKKKNRKLKTLLSVGGFTNSQLGKFEVASNTTAGRQKFASTCINRLAYFGFDGIDIDWEYPTSAKEGANFVLLLKEVRAALDRYENKYTPGYHYQLTVATSAGPYNYQYLPLADINAIVDSIHLMAYDYAGSWDTTTGHQSNLYPDTKTPLATKASTSAALTVYLAKGVTASKVLLGMPLYGRSFLNTNGLGQSYKGVGAGTNEPGVWLFKDLPRPGASVYVKSDLGAMYTYDAKTKELVTTDGVTTTKLKATYLRNQGLGGAFFWEASGDKNGTDSLIRTMATQNVNLDQTQNQLNYPASIYANIKAGMPGE